MKKLFTNLKLLLIVALLVSGITVLKSQDFADQSQVLQKCIDLSELQSYYPVEEDGSFKPINVMNHVVSFPEGIDVMHSGQELSFIDRSEAANQDAYFIFRKFDVSEDQAFINGNYMYDQTSSQPRVLMITMTLSKNGGSWEVATINLGGDVQ